MPRYPITDREVHYQLQSEFSKQKEKGQSSKSITTKMKEKIGIKVVPRTIDNYMGKTAEAASIQPDTLDALCQVLLNMGYETAKRKYNPQPLKHDDNGAYWDFLRQTYNPIKILDMDSPIALEAVYIPPTFLSKPRSRTGYEFVKLLPNRLSPDQNTEYILADDVLAQHRHLLVMGLPGAGKTTWLRYLVLQCLEQSLQEETYLPLYIELQTITPDRYHTFMDGLVDILAPHLPEPKMLLDSYLESGQVLLLGDGLDRVSPDHLSFIYQGIDDLVMRYPQNRVIITCRTKSFSEYKFPRFAEVELRGFSKLDILSLAGKWFSLQTQPDPDSEDATTDAAPLLHPNPTHHPPETNIINSFTAQLNEQDTIAQLAANPLLAVFLLLTFEQTGKLVRRKLTLYQDVIHVLIHDWERQHRDFYYRPRSSEALDRRMLEDILSVVAYTSLTLHREEMEKFRLADIVDEFLQRTGSRLDPQEVIDEIEARYGIFLEFAKGHYTFQHRTVQEYFASRYIVMQGDQVLTESVTRYFPDPFFQEVFPLVADRLSNCDRMLEIIAGYINKLVMEHEVLNRYLQWLEATTTWWQKDAASSGWASLLLALDLDTPLYTTRLKQDTAVNRTPFHDLAIGIQRYNHNRKTAKRNTGFLNVALWLAIIYSLAQDFLAERLEKANHLPLKKAPEYIRDVLEVTEATTLAEELSKVIRKAEGINEQKIARLLAIRQESLPSPDAPIESWTQWLDDLRAIMTEHFNIGHEVDMNQRDYQLLVQYVYSNNLLLRCITESYTATLDLKHQLVDQMLSPFKNEVTHPPDMASI